MSLTPEVDAAVMRNVALAIRLRRTIAKLHRLDTEHARFSHWRGCSHPDCRAVVMLLATSFVCERCNQTFPLTSGGGGRFCGRCNELGSLARLVVER